MSRPRQDASQPYICLCDMVLIAFPPGGHSLGLPSKRPAARLVIPARAGHDLPGRRIGNPNPSLYKTSEQLQMTCSESRQALYLRTGACPNKGKGKQSHARAMRGVSCIAFKKKHEDLSGPLFLAVSTTSHSTLEVISLAECGRDGGGHGRCRCPMGKSRRLRLQIAGGGPVPAPRQGFLRL